MASDLNRELIGRVVTITAGEFAGRSGVVLYVDRQGVMVEIPGAGHHYVRPAWVGIRKDVPAREMRL